MRILVTNDDGVASPGLWILARELEKVGEVIVVAPSRDMSGTAVAMMMRRPAHVRPAKPRREFRHLRAYAVGAPPATCVLLGLRGTVGGGGIDLVVSGVNNGANLGRDVLLSGTVGAALMASLEGVPAIAVSASDGITPYWETAASVAGRLAERLRDVEARGNILLNLNVPSVPLAELRGVKLSRLSRGCCLSRLSVLPADGRVGTFNLTALPPERQAEDEGTDEWAVVNGYVSLTPLAPDMATDHADSRLRDLLVDLIPLTREAGADL